MPKKKETDYCTSLNKTYICTRFKMRGAQRHIYIEHTDLKLWHKKEHINRLREKEETNTVSESVWHLQTVVKYLHVVEQKDVKNYLYLLN